MIHNAEADGVACDGPIVDPGLLGCHRIDDGPEQGKQEDRHNDRRTTMRGERENEGSTREEGREEKEG
jgi:hypothetical protein